MISLKFIVVATLLLLSAGTAAQGSATGSGGLDNGNPRVEAELLFDVDSVYAGSTFTSAIHLRIDPGWHIYWRNSGGTGFPTTVEFGSKLAKFNPVSFPAPEFISSPSDPAMTYGYNNETLIFAKSFADPEPGQRLIVNASVTFLVCKVICIPDEIKLRSELPVVSSSTASSAINQSLFSKFENLVPVSPESLELTAHAHISTPKIMPDMSFELGLRLSRCEQNNSACRIPTEFVSMTDLIALDSPDSLDLDVVGLLPSTTTDNNTLLVLKGKVLPGMETPREFSAVMQVSIDDTIKHIRVAVGLRGPPFNNETTIPTNDLAELHSEDSSTNLWLAIVFGLVGGLLLNFMPCVLPVLALKTFRLIESGNNDHSHNNRELAAAYLIGVLVSMLALSLLVIILKLAGEQVGWGFQFQHPVFLVFMASLLTVFALNLFGLFDFNLTLDAFSQTRSLASPGGVSFLDGALMVLLATPCSAPYLGTAVGFAFAGNSSVILAIFLSIGIGLSTPYCVLLLMPQLRKWLPKPGEWMLRLRTIMGFLLLATALWIVWISGHSTGTSGVIQLLSALLILSFVFWSVGVYQKSDGTHTRLACTVAMTAFLISIYAAASIEPADEQPGQSNSYATWHPDVVKKQLIAGNPVFVNFTADWCLTCKVNERFVLSNPEIIAAMDRRGVVRLQADWTRRNESIRKELQAHGRAGVPLYLLYSANSNGKPTVLPEILTPDIVRNVLEKISPVSDPV